MIINIMAIMCAALAVIGFVATRNLAVRCPVCGRRSTLVPSQVESSLALYGEYVESAAWKPTWTCNWCGADLTDLCHAEFARRWPKKWRTLKALPELRKQAIEYNKRRRLRVAGDNE